MTETNLLLRAFAESGSEAAFGQLVTQYVDLVFSTALRRVDGDAHRAEDIVQTVFSDLARKAKTLPTDVMLGGWLHRHCCFVASNVRRSETRRAAREREAVAMETVHAPESNWPDIAPELDEAIEQLTAEDRDAIVLRFFEKRDFRSIGEMIGATENAAQKRVARALDKLRELLAQRGVALSVAALGTFLTAKSVEGAPVALAARTTATALRLSPRTAAVAAGSSAIFVALMILLGAGILTALVVGLSNAATKSSKESNQTRAFASIDADSQAGNPRATNTASTLGSSIAPRNAAPLDLNGPILRLTILAADSEQVIPNVPISYKSIEGTKWATKDLAASRNGVCLVPYTTNTVDLEVVTRVEGFADTRLHWQIKRGDAIPETYILKLKRGRKIGGKVLNARNELVPGATVHLDTSGAEEGDYNIENNDFGSASIVAEDGTWQTERLTDFMLTRIFGRAKHPAYADSDQIAQGDLKAAELLRAGQHVFHLAEGARIRGIVVNESGEPVAGANVLVGGVNMSGSRKEKVGADGRFDIGGCVAGKTLLTATAKGYAGTTINAVVDDSNKEYRLTLKPGTILKLQLVNQRGEPISKAYVWLNTMHSGSLEFTNKPLTQVQPNLRTDAEGRVRWNDAPDGDLIFDFDVKGYMRMSSVKVAADGEEHTFTLTPGVKVHGTVTDALTGRPIPKFRVIAGYPSKSARPGDTNWNVFWSTFDRHWIPGLNGRYEQTFEEPIVHGVPEIRYIFKFEADGYKTATTRVVEANEGDVEFNVALDGGGAARLTVLAPNGKPAPDTAVSFRQRVSLFYLHDYTIAGFGIDPILTADANGQTPLDIGNAQIVIAAGAAGFALANAADVEATHTIQLQPWGRVEGRVTKRGQPIPDWKIILQGNLNRAGVNMRTAEIQTDADGKFTFNYVPPLAINVMRLIPGEGNSWTYEGLQELQISPGQTARVDYDEHGVTLVAHVRLAFNLAPSQQLFVRAIVKMPSPPRDMTNGPAMMAWFNRPEIQAAHARAKQRNFAQRADGVWICEDVPPGDWVAYAAISEPSGDRNFAYREIASAKVEFQVSESDANQIDIGELVLEKPKAP
jgi:RNA polymerase sigma factor (sigma-70 family)